MFPTAHTHKLKRPFFLDRAIPLYPPLVKSTGEHSGLVLLRWFCRALATYSTPRISLFHEWQVMWLQILRLANSFRHREFQIQLFFHHPNIYLGCMTLLHRNLKHRINLNPETKSFFHRGPRFRKRQPPLYDDSLRTPGYLIVLLSVSSSPLLSSWL